MRWRLLLLALAVLAIAAQDQRPVVVSVRGHIFAEPAFIVVKTRVEPHDGNRGLWVSLVSDGFETSSYEQLSGRRARITRWHEFKDVPAGAYEVRADLARQPSGRFSDRVSVFVVGRQ